MDLTSFTDTYYQNTLNVYSYYLQSIAVQFVGTSRPHPSVKQDHCRIVFGGEIIRQLRLNCIPVSF